MARKGNPFWHKGMPKIGGRTKGTPNAVLRNAREFALACLNDPVYQKKLVERLKAGRAGRMEELLWHYAHGKPTEHVEVTGADGGAIQVQEVERVSQQFTGRILRLVANGPARAVAGGDGADGAGGS